MIGVMPHRITTLDAKERKRRNLTLPGLSES